MQPFFDHDNLTLYCGDLRDVLPTLPESSVDFVVTDPPYGLGFMEKDWDYEVPGPEFWRAIARVCKPGAALFQQAARSVRHHRLESLAGLHAASYAQPHLPAFGREKAKIALSILGGTSLSGVESYRIFHHTIN